MAEQEWKGNSPEEFKRYRRWWRSFKKRAPKFIKGLKERHPELFLNDGKPTVTPEAKVEDPISVISEARADDSAPVLPDVVVKDSILAVPEDKVEAPAQVITEASEEVVKPVRRPEEDEYVKSAKRIERRQMAQQNLKLGQIWEISGVNSLTEPHFVIVTDCDPFLKRTHKGVKYWEIRVVPIEVGDKFYFIADGDLVIDADDPYNPFKPCGQNMVLRLWNEHRMLASDLIKPVTEISLEAYFFSKLVLKPQLPTPQQSQIITLIDWERPEIDPLLEFRIKKYQELSRVRDKLIRFESELEKIFKSTKLN